MRYINSYIGYTCSCASNVDAIWKPAHLSGRKLFSLTFGRSRCHAVARHRLILWGRVGGGGGGGVWRLMSDGGGEHHGTSTSDNPDTAVVIRGLSDNVGSLLSRAAVGNS